MYKERVCEFIKEFSNLIVNVDMFEEKINDCKSWKDFYLDSGYPELIVYILEAKDLDIDLDWDSALKEYIKRFRSNIYISDSYLISSSGILYGYCGIGYMCLYLSKYGINVDKALTSINKRIETIAERKLETARDNIKNNDVTYSDYDVIDGLSSTLRYLLEFENIDIFKNLINEIVLYLIETTQFSVEEYNLPNCYIKSAKLHEINREKYGNGIIDYGVSHGIAGTLSSLSIAVLSGIEVEGTTDCIITILNRLKETKKNVQGKSYWSTILSIENNNNIEYNYDFNEYGWCYGVAGTARAIYLGGQASKKKEHMDIAIETFKELCENIENIEMNTYILCHGYSGLLLILNEMYTDTKIEIFKNTADMLTSKVINNIKIDEILNSNNNIEDRGQKNISMLEGIVGIVLALVNYNDSSKNLISKIMLIK